MSKWAKWYPKLAARLETLCNLWQRRKTGTWSLKTRHQRGGGGGNGEGGGPEVGGGDVVVGVREGASVWPAFDGAQLQSRCQYGQSGNHLWRDSLCYRWQFLTIYRNFLQNGPLKLIKFPHFQAKYLIFHGFELLIHDISMGISYLLSRRKLWVFATIKECVTLWYRSNKGC